MRYFVERAEAEIYAEFGAPVSVLAKAKSLFKFGRNPSIGVTAETLWEIGGNETYVTTNIIDTISSSNAADNQSIRIEGHTVSGTGTDAEFTFVVQNATLNGQNKVTLATPLARVSRIFNNDQSESAGDIYVYEDTAITAGVPDDLTKAHISLLGTLGATQSYKAATTFSKKDYGLLTGVNLSVFKKTSGSLDFRLEVRRPGNVFRPVFEGALSSTAQSTIHIPFEPLIIVPANSDVRVVAVGSVADMSGWASFQAFLALDRRE